MTLCINPRCDKPQNSDNAQFCQNCQSTLLLKQRYRAIKVLGEGGFGKTYEASDLGTPNKVIKVLINNSPKAVELFQREAEVLSQLSNPGIPRVEPNSYIVIDPGDSQEPVHCLVMEKMEGMNLRDYLKQLRNPIDPETAERWLKELVLILQEVHKQGILHRDIKPQNIILKPDGRLALIDFGAVKEGTGTEVATKASSLGSKTEVATHAKDVGTSISSTGYTPIEQMNGQTVKQSDFFALGRTFVFLLTGREPTDKSMYDAFNDELRWQEYTTNASPQLVSLINHMMARLPKERPANAQTILKELEGIQAPQKPQGQEESKSKDIEIEIAISSVEAFSGTSKTVSFSRTVYPKGSTNSCSQQSKKLTVTVPPNSQHGTRLKLEGQGHEGVNGSFPGDVYVRLVVENKASSIPLSEPTSTSKPKTSFGKRIAIGLTAALLSFAGRALFSAFTNSNSSVSSSMITSQSSCGLVSQGSNVRATPNGQILGQVSSGTSLLSTGAIDGQWIEISAPVTGWIHASRIIDTCSGNSGL